MAEAAFSHMGESPSDTVDPEPENSPKSRLLRFCKAAVEEMDSKIQEFKLAARDKESQECGTSKKAGQLTGAVVGLIPFVGKSLQTPTKVVATQGAKLLEQKLTRHTVKKVAEIFGSFDEGNGEQLEYWHRKILESFFMIFMGFFNQMCRLLENTSYGAQQAMEKLAKDAVARLFDGLNKMISQSDADVQQGQDITTTVMIKAFLAGQSDGNGIEKVTSTGLGGTIQLKNGKAIKTWKLFEKPDIVNKGVVHILEKEKSKYQSRDIFLDIEHIQDYPDGQNKVMPMKLTICHTEKESEYIGSDEAFLHFKKEKDDLLSRKDSLIEELLSLCCPIEQGMAKMLSEVADRVKNMASGYCEAETTAKKANFMCNGAGCTDNTPVYDLDNDSGSGTEGSFKYESIIKCFTCMSDDDDFFYHPECFRALHGKRKYLGHESTSFSVEEMSKLSEDRRKTTLLQGTSDKALALTSALSAISADTALTGLSFAGNAMDEILLFTNNNLGSGTKSLGMGATLALSGGVTAVLTVGTMAWDARQWRLGNIDSEQFKIRCIKNVVCNATTFAFASLGSFIGTLLLPLLPVVGTVVGGILGALLGGLLNYVERAAVDIMFDHYEDRKRAELVIEAMFFLELPALHVVTPAVVKCCYRRLALDYHPDSQRVSSCSEQEREIAKVNFQLLSHAKHVMLEFLENQHHYSSDCKIFIRTEKARRDLENDPLLCFSVLREHLDKGIKTNQSLN